MRSNYTPDHIASLVRDINNEQESLDAQLKNIQNNLCQHINFTKKCDGSSGNYDPSADSYWIDWECQDCGKHMTTDQGYPYTQSKVFPDKIVIDNT
jgi:hypothetical protein